MSGEGDQDGAIATAPPSRAAAREISAAVGVALTVALVAWGAIRLTRLESGMTVVWIASGLLAGLLLTSPRRRWTAYVLAALAGNVLARYAYGDAIGDVLARGFACTLEGALVAWAVRWRCGEPLDYDQPLTLGLVAAVSTLGACALSALVVAGASAARGGPFFAPLVLWWASHGLGIVISATLLLVARRLGWRVFGRPGRRLQLMLDLALLTITALVVFLQSRYPLLFLVYPPLLLLVFREGFAGMVLGTCVVLVVSVWATLAGSGPVAMVAGASMTERVLLLQMFIAMTCSMTIPAAIALTERNHLERQLRASERDYRLLADYSRDLVVRLGADGRPLYISPSVRDILGWKPAELSDSGWGLVHPTDRARLQAATAALLRDGEPATLLYRMLHKQGYYVYIEALAQRVPGARPGDPGEIVYSGRDVTLRVQAERALAENQQRLRAIADNLPALVAHVDASERYTFVNAALCEALGRGPEAILGQNVSKVLGWRIYNEVRPHVQAALAGERVVFDAEREFGGVPRTYQATYIPDVAATGSRNGFYVLMVDVSQLKLAQRELALLARYDNLTGLANRLQFSERLELALARQRRHACAIALLYVDIDHFKRINDTLGHAVGDAVLRELALRLRGAVREIDLAARIGGDEFVVLLEEVESAEAAELVAGHMLAAIRPPFDVMGQRIHLTVSIGIAVMHADATVDALMHRADDALYSAKAAGRDTYRVAAGA